MSLVYGRDGSGRQWKAVKVLKIWFRWNWFYSQFSFSRFLRLKHDEIQSAELEEKKQTFIPLRISFKFHSQIPMPPWYNKNHTFTLD